MQVEKIDFTCRASVGFMLKYNFVAESLNEDMYRQIQLSYIFVILIFRSLRDNGGIKKIVPIANNVPNARGETYSPKVVKTANQVRSLGGCQGFCKGGSDVRVLKDRACKESRVCP